MFVQFPRGALATLEGMSQSERVSTWIADVTGGESMRGIARKVGVTQPTIKRRLELELPLAIFQIAEAYGANPVIGLIEAGLITGQDLRQAVPLATINATSTPALLAELARRLGIADELAAVLAHPITATDTGAGDNGAAPATPGDYR